MAESGKNRTSERGITIVEMLIVVLIIAIVAALAFMQMDSPNTKFKRQNVSRELKVAFERARFDSVKRHAEGAGPATVIVEPNSYTLKTDLNQNGTFETSESVVTDFTAQNITIALPGNAFFDSVTITFDKRGEPTALVDPGAVVDDPQFYVCNGSCPPMPTAANADRILVTPTGTVTLLGGGESLPVFANANVTNPPVYISSPVRLP